MPRRSNARAVHELLDTLHHVGPPVPVERRACELVGWDSFRAFAVQHYRLTARWPRACLQCGTEHRGPQRSTVRCAKCRAAGPAPAAVRRRRRA